MTLSTTPTFHAVPTLVNPDGLFDPAPFGYSQAAIAPAGCRLAFVSGQGGANASGALAPDFAAQVERAFANLLAALAGIGARTEQVVKLTILVVDHDPSKLGVLLQHLAQTFGEARPAQTLIPVPRLVLDGMLFEVEAVTVLEG